MGEAPEGFEFVGECDRKNPVHIHPAKIIKPIFGGKPHVKAPDRIVEPEKRSGCGADHFDANGASVPCPDAGKSLYQDTECIETVLKDADENDFHPQIYPQQDELKMLAAEVRRLRAQVAGYQDELIKAQATLRSKDKA